MTANGVRLALATGSAVVSAIGAIVGIFVGIYVLPVILEQVLSAYGIVQLPLVLNGGVSAGLARILVTE